MGEVIYSDINKCTSLCFSKTQCILRGVRTLNVTSTQEMQCQKSLFSLRPQLSWSLCVTSVTWIISVASWTHDIGCFVDQTGLNKILQDWVLECIFHVSVLSSIISVSLQLLWFMLHTDKQHNVSSK